jgi:uncharacterized protein (DUF1697 family)
MMKTYVAFLRGVMPVGKNKVAMAQLRQVLAEAGFEDVRTYIQSGNVILRTDLTPAEIEKRVHDLIREHIGPDLVVVVRTGDQLQEILGGNPFEGLDISRVFYTLFAQPPPADKVNKLISQDYSPEKIVIDGQCAYLFIPTNAARSTLSNNYLEKKLGVSATTRNNNTLRKVIEMSVQGQGHE